ncbi:MAG: phosphoesterase [Legionellales bacterium]|nr:phosphoesterase [Legionellales bacterium]|tara:strand:- start:6874 stop:9240 length:2367 start_codon:yes stop_codon:yes gene_type:complete
MAKYVERGLESHHEQDQRQLIRDTRTLGERFADFFAEPFNATLILAVLAGSVFIVPAVADIVFLCGLGLFAFTYTRKTTLPFRLPQVANRPDYNDTQPGTGKPLMARGICYLGNERSDNAELWFSNEDMRTHVLIFGSTGSGKTEALISFAYNALLQGSGFIYIDGKGENSLFAKVYSMARQMGREDDVLLVNFMTGARDVFGPQAKRLSNTLNPFARGSSSMLAQLVVSLMDSSSATPDGDMWKGRAISFVEALMILLAHVRDEGHVLLDANTIRNYFHLPKLEQIVVDKQFPLENGETVPLDDVPPVVLEPITNFVLTLPGYDKAKKGKQVSQVLEQHGFITMQLTRVFTSLADTYGHILRTDLPEVDLKDVVLNRRILVVLLPALEKAPEELSNLGKIIVSTLKAMMSSGLGSDVEGTYGELIRRKPTNSPTPFMCIMDEYGYYAVEGFAVVPAQARSLGFSAIFAGQDLPAFQKASKEEAASIGANTNIKICMKLEDPTETWEFFMKTAGEAYVTKVDAFQTSANSVMNNYLDTRSASTEKRQRIELTDLKEQGLGEGHFFFKSRIIRGRTFYAAPKVVNYMRLNHFLKVGPPPSKLLVEFEGRSSRFIQALKELKDYSGVESDLEDINLMVEKLRSDEGGAIERGVEALLAYHGHHTVPEVEEEVDDTPLDELNLFVPIRLSDPTIPMLVGENFESFAEPLVKKAETRARVEFIERLSGKVAKHASSVANEIIKDMQLATFYPPHITNQPSAAELAASVDELTEHVALKITSKQQETDFNDEI